MFLCVFLLQKNYLLLLLRIFFSIGNLCDMLKGIFIEFIISYDLFFVVEYQKDSISEWIKIEMIINSKNTAREDFKNSCNRHYGTDSVHKLWNYSFHQFVRKRFIKLFHSIHTGVFVPQRYLPESFQYHNDRFGDQSWTFSNARNKKKRERHERKGEVSVIDGCQILSNKSHWWKLNVYFWADCKHGSIINMWFTC